MSTPPTEALGQLTAALSQDDVGLVVARMRPDVQESLDAAGVAKPSATTASSRPFAPRCGRLLHEALGRRPAVELIRPDLCSRVLQPLGEELERLAGLRLLCALEIHALPREEGARLRRGLEGLGGGALGRQFENA